MAGKPLTRARAETGKKPATRKRNSATVKRSAASKKLYGELVAIAAETGGDEIARMPRTTPERVLNDVLQRIRAHYTVAAAEVDKLKVEELWVETSFGPKPSKWVAMEHACRDEIQALAGLMSKLGLAERAVAVEEAQTRMLSQALAAAAERAGLSTKQRKALGDALADEINTVNSTAIEVVR